MRSQVTTYSWLAIFGVRCWYCKTGLVLMHLCAGLDLRWRFRIFGVQVWSVAQVLGRKRMVECPLDDAVSNRIQCAVCRMIYIIYIYICELYVCVFFNFYIFIYLNVCFFNYTYKYVCVRALWYTLDILLFFVAMIDMVIWSCLSQGSPKEKWIAIRKHLRGAPRRQGPKLSRIMEYHAGVRKKPLFESFTVSFRIKNLMRDSNIQVVVVGVVLPSNILGLDCL